MSRPQTDAGRRARSAALRFVAGTGCSSPAGVIKRGIKPLSEWLAELSRAELVTGSVAPRAPRTVRVSPPQGRRLTREQVEQVWLWSYAGASNSRIARELGVSPTSIWELLHGQTYGDVVPPERPSCPTCPAHLLPSNASPTQSEIDQMIQLRRDGAAFDWISDQLGWAESTVRRYAGSVGPQRPPQKLSREQVAELTRLHSQGATYSQMSAELGVSVRTRRRICRRLGLPAVRGRPSVCKLTPEQATEARQLVGLGCSRAEVGRLFGVSRQIISMLVQGRSYRPIAGEVAV